MLFFSVEIVVFENVDWWYFVVIMWFVFEIDVCIVIYINLLVYRFDFFVLVFCNYLVELLVEFFD